MLLEKQVCTFKQARKLKELGVKQYTSLFFYNLNKKHTPIVYKFNVKDISFIYSAYTVAELGQMLPTHINNRDFYMRYCWKGYSFGYNGRHLGLEPIIVDWFNNEAEARAELLIKLISENYIKDVEKINERLMNDVYINKTNV